MPRSSVQPTAVISFGILLRQLRKRAGMTQRDLAAALGYSDSLISGLETAHRQPDIEAVIQRFVPALGLQDDPALAAYLLECAAIERGEHVPVTHFVSPAPQKKVERAKSAHHLPALPVELIGRRQAVQQLGNRLLGHGGRMLTLVGPPGVGKTTLALAVAKQVQQHYANGAHFIPLAAINDATLMAAAIVATVAPGDNSNKPPQTRVFELLRPQATLLVLDNLEQIAGAASLIATLLAECPGVTILATSRERLHLRAEQRFKVPPLDLSAAVTLFVQRAQAVDEDFRLTDENRTTITTICARLDCLPLALELCAVQVELFAPAQLLAQLQARPLDLLTNGAHDLPPQHRTLRLAIARSYALLNAEEQILFRRLGVFVGGFDLAAVEAIVDSTALVSRLQSPVFSLQSLIGKSLVRAEPLEGGEQRFSLLETVREFASEQLQMHGEEESARNRHYHIYLQRFRLADFHLRGPEAPVWFARLQPEHDNMRAAIQWAFDGARYTDVAWMVLAVSWFWEYCNHQFEVSKWLLPLVPHAHTLGPDLHLAIWVLLNCYADHAIEVSQKAMGVVEEGMSLLANNSDKLLQSAAWQVIADKSEDLSQANAAREHVIALSRATDGSPALGSEFGQLADRDFLLGFELWRYALALTERGEFVQAASLAQESLAILQTRGNVYEQAGGLGTLGYLALLQGELGQAHKLLTQALTYATIDKTLWMLCYWQPFLGLATLYRGEISEARRLLLESRASSIELKRKHLLPRISIYLAETALWEGVMEEAERWLAECISYTVDPHQLGAALINCLLVAAHLAVTRQEYAQAAMLLGLAEETRRRACVTLVEPIHAQVDGALAEVQEALGPARFADAFAAGQQMALENAFSAMLLPSRSPVHIAPT